MTYISHRSISVVFYLIFALLGGVIILYGLMRLNDHSGKAAAFDERLAGILSESGIVEGDIAKISGINCRSGIDIWKEYRRKIVLRRPDDLSQLLKQFNALAR
jgi:hypothetical protein